MIDRISRFLAILVLVAGTAYVMVEQPWFQRCCGLHNLPAVPPGIIRSMLSRHR